MARPASSMTGSHLYGTRCLADVVSFDRQSQIVLVGGSRDLESYLTGRGADYVVCTAESFESPAACPVPPGSADRVIVTSTRAYDRRVLAAYGQALRPGGWLLAGGKNRRRDPRNTAAWSVRRTRADLMQVGFDEVAAYGVRNGLASPRFVVPLDHARSLRWFMTSIFLPTTPRGALAVNLLARRPLLGVATLLFVDLAFVARRAPAPA